MRSGGAFSDEEIQLLRGLPAVSNVTRDRITYSDTFRQVCTIRYLAGESPTKIFREAGLPPELVGYKRIERSVARWKDAAIKSVVRSVSSQVGSQIGRALVRGVLAPEYLLDYLRYFVLFEDDGKLVKKIAVRGIQTRGLAGTNAFRRRRLARHATDAADAREQLAGTLDALPDAYLELDRDGLCLDAHVRHSALFANQPGPLAGHDIRTLLAPEPAAILTAALAAADAHGSDMGRTLQIEAGGQTHWFELAVTARPGAGTTRFIVLARDITARRQMEEQLRISEARHRLIADNATDVIVTMDLAGAYTYVSPSVEKLRGFTPEEAFRQSQEEVFSADSVATVRAYFAQLRADLEAGRPIENFRGELEQRCKDGSTVWTDVSANPLLSPDGSFVEVLGVSRDISERKRYESRLREAHAAAEAANAGIVAGTAAYNDGEPWLSDVLDYLDVNRRLVAERLPF